MEDYFENESIFRRGQTLIDVTISRDEIAALTAVQNGLRRGIAQSGIVIEVNPSSNLLIGDLLDLRNHPILRLFPPVPEPGGPPPVMIALGSDDPLTFSTQLLREYTLLHEAASAAGYPERVVEDWLETIRRTGMDARFTRAWRPNAEKKTELLIRDLSRYLHMPENY
jgi:adenosine deaminase